MKARRDLHFTSVMMAGVITILSGCVATGGDSASASDTAAKKVSQYVAEANLSPKQRFIKALEYLEHGEELKATVELEEYLKHIPNSSRGKSLLEQINQDPQQYFPDTSFPVTLSSGESLSTLAKKYLGSALKFYALAKYNDIANPSRVNIGQTVNIPLTEEAKAARNQAKTNSEAKDQKVAVPVEKAKAITVEEVIEDNSSKVTKKVVDEKPVVTEQMLITKLTTAVEKPDFKDAITQLTALKGFGVLSEQSRPLAIKALEGRANALSGSNKELASEYLLEAAELNIASGNSIPAINNYKFAVHLDPSNADAAEDLGILQKEVSDQLHREASSAFRRQELDIAIEKWDRVLEINPDYTSAKLYRAQALELKARLDKIKD